MRARDVRRCPIRGWCGRIIRQRQLRARFFDGELFADPAWDMLLDLTAARVEARRVSVTSLCIASGVPPTTALRWIGADDRSSACSSGSRTKPTAAAPSSR